MVSSKSTNRLQLKLLMHFLQSCTIFSLHVRFPEVFHQFHGKHIGYNLNITSLKRHLRVFTR